MEALVFVLWQLLACSKIIGKFQIKNRQSLFTFYLSSSFNLTRFFDNFFSNFSTHWNVEDRERCLKWCSMRLNEGFNGRPDKKDDTCYTFWVGATLKLLNDDKEETSFANAEILHCLDFVLSTQDGITGGLAKWPELSPDPLHTYLGLAGLALVPFAGLRPVDPQLNITKRARAFVDNLHNQSS